MKNIHLYKDEKMRKTIQLIILLFFTTISFAQRALDKSLNEATSDLAYKLVQKNKTKAVVLYITDIGKSQTIAGKYIADVVSYNLVNNSGNFEVFDRDNLSGITEAKKLIAEGYIDVNTAKELGKILSVETIIIGNYTVLSNAMKLYLKALDSNTGFVIAATMKDLILDSDAGSLLGINVETNSGRNNSNRGFNNRPLNSNEDYNNPTTVTKDCETNKTGDYCFQNNTMFNINVSLGQKKCTLKPDQVQCFYNLKVGPWSYKIISWKNDEPKIIYHNSDLNYKANGQVFVEQCKSKTFIIK
jgi:hypothetical protein